MSIVWTLTSPKGGAGKTTLGICIAGELANRGVKVTIIDADPREWMHKWKEENENPQNIHVLRDSDPDGKTLENIIAKARQDSDFVLIDTEGTNNIRANLALKFTDLAIIPVQSSTPDMQAGLIAANFVKSVSETEGTTIPYIIVRVNTSAAIYDREAKTVDKALAIEKEPVLATRLVSRSGFKTMRTYGGTVYTLQNKEAAGLKKCRQNTSDLLDDIMTYYADMMEAA